MKNGKKLSRRQKELLKNRRLNPENWLVTKNLPRELHLMHKHTGRERVVPVH